MPSGPGVIGDDLISKIAATVPARDWDIPADFASTSCGDSSSSKRFCRTNTIQLCDHLAVGTHRDLKMPCLEFQWFKVVHVSGTESVEEAAQCGAAT